METAVHMPITMALAAYVLLWLVVNLASHFKRR